MTRDTILAIVLKWLRDELGGTGDTLTETTVLYDVAGFDSLRIAALIECLEARLGVELPPESMRPEVFASAVALAEAFLAAWRSNHARSQAERGDCRL
jgi:acyl carrier protein